MIHTIQFNELSAMLLDFVDDNEGFLYLRMVGAEPVVNAIWARLVSNESRGKKWGSAISIPVAGQSYPQYVAAQKQVTYRTLRTRLPSGMVDLALIHPLLTVAEDNQRGFYILAYEPGVPAGFFDRLNKSLSIPLKPEWEQWLWEQGQQPQSRMTLENTKVFEDGQYVEKPRLVETTEIPITLLKSIGLVRCYSVLCSGRYSQAWAQIIRRQLNLGIQLKPTAGKGGSRRYTANGWAIYPTSESWALQRGDDLITQVPSLNFALAYARETLGVHFVLEEE